MKIFNNNNNIEVGIDECARGCLFGRLYTAAVIKNYLEKKEKYYIII